LNGHGSEKGSGKGRE
jgi:S1-C subfamily serine protease